MTPQGLISQALAYQASSLVLEKSIEKNILTDDRQELIDTGLYQSAVVLLVLAIEIAL